MATKLELQQHINRLTTELVALRATCAEQAQTIKDATSDLNFVDPEAKLQISDDLSYAPPWHAWSRKAKPWSKK